MENGKFQGLQGLRAVIYFSGHTALFPKSQTLKARLQNTANLSTSSFAAEQSPPFCWLPQATTDPSAKIAAHA